MTNRSMQVKVRKLRASRRKKYMNSPKHAGPAVGWLDWVHGKAIALTKFEAWFFGERVMLPQVMDADPGVITRESSNARRAELHEEDSRISLDSPKSAKERVETMRKKLEAVLQIKLYNCIVLFDDDITKVCLAWVSQSEYYILKRFNDGTIYRSIKYESRDKAFKKFHLGAVLYQQKINLDEIAPPAKPYLVGEGNIPYEKAYKKLY
jgi:hypothetical protein